MNSKNAKFDSDNIHPIKMILLEGQAEIILRALELYAYKSLNNTENKIIELIKSNKYITQPEIAKILNLSENCIYKNLKILKNKNLISRIGANKNGYWEIRDNLMDNVRDKEINFDEIIKNII